MKQKPYLSFREDQSFRILYLTDIQEGLFPRKDTFRLLEAVLKSADPDLVREPFYCRSITEAERKSL